MLKQGYYEFFIDLVMKDCINSVHTWACLRNLDLALKDYYSIPRYIYIPVQLPPTSMHLVKYLSNKLIRFVVNLEGLQDRHLTPLSPF